MLEELKPHGDSEEDVNKDPEEQNVQQGGKKVPKNLRFSLGGWLGNDSNNNNDNDKFVSLVVWQYKHLDAIFVITPTIRFWKGMKKSLE